MPITKNAVATADYENRGIPAPVKVNRVKHSTDRVNMTAHAGESTSSPSHDARRVDSDLHALLLEHCIDAIVAHTPDGVLLYANKEALMQWRCESFEQVADLGPWGWIPPEQRTKAAHRMSLLTTNGEARFDSVGRSACGEPYAAEIHARLLETADGPVIVSVVRDISSRVRTEEMVRYLAYHDTLTGLANRALFNQELTHALAAAERHDDHVGLLFIDIDDFKPVNDTYGHAKGDHALRKIAGRISSCVRLTDTVARIGGDEFIVLLPRLRSPEDLQVISEKIAQEVSQPMRIGEASVTVTPSMGLAIHESGEAGEDFVARADHAMYESRNAFVAGSRSAPG